MEVTRCNVDQAGQVVLFCKWRRARSVSGRRVTSSADNGLRAPSGAVASLSTLTQGIPALFRPNPDVA
jgi:hypothetical protein